MECERKPKSIASCFFEILKRGKMTAKEISKRSGVTEANISKFRKGGDIYSSTYERLVEALPKELKRQYYLLLSEDKSPIISEYELKLKAADDIEQTAYQLRQSRIQDN